MLKKHFVFDKEYFKTLAAVALPIAMQNVINHGVSAMDTIMLGELGDIAVSGASLGGQTFFLMMICGFGVCGGASVLIAQYWGKGNVDVIRRVMRISTLAMFTISVLFSLAGFLFTEQIMSLFSNEPEVIAAGVSYLKTLSLGFVFYSLSNCYFLALRGVEQVKVSTTVYAMSFFVNVIVNYIFIFGKFGAPALGVQGAAVGTVSARIFEFFCAFVYMYFIEKRVGFKWHCMFKIDKTLIPDFIHHALPVMGNELIWGMGSVTTGIIMGHIGSTFVAANSVVTVVYNLSSVFTFGVANAAAVICGKTIGQGRMDRAQKTAITINLTAFCIGFIMSMVVLLIRSPFLSIYNITPQAKLAAFQMLTVVICIQPLAAIDIVNIVGVLRGGGDTKLALLLDGGGMWLINIPLSVLLGLVLGAPAPFVYLSMRCDAFIKIIIELRRIISGQWIRTVTRDNA
ncbi:MAG: MATE family efflux transporter [Oscillospiraceae bacterium]|nr:MATE family efflux transporter [Oscillospiraceae bacterium]